MGTGTRMGTGTMTGLGRAEERRRSARNRTRTVDAIRHLLLFRTRHHLRCRQRTALAGTRQLRSQDLVPGGVTGSEGR